MVRGKGSNNHFNVSYKFNPMGKETPLPEKTQWQKQLEARGLTEPTWDCSEMRSWVKKHYKTRFVPEDVLKVMGLKLNDDESMSLKNVSGAYGKII